MTARHLIPALLVLSCSGGSPAKKSNLCVPGQSVACVGVGGCPGGQSCLLDGSGYSACSCNPAASTAAASSSGASGSAATSATNPAAGVLSASSYVHLDTSGSLRQQSRRSRHLRRSLRARQTAPRRRRRRRRSASALSSAALAFGWAPRRASPAVGSPHRRRAGWRWADWPLGEHVVVTSPNGTEGIDPRHTLATRSARAKRASARSSVAAGDADLSSS